MTIKPEREKNGLMWLFFIQSFVFLALQVA